MSVDTACSSSLVAAHLAAGQLLSGAASQAVVGGVSIQLNPSTTAMFQSTGMLSPDGRCKSLDASADGYVRAESCGVLLLSSTANPEPGSVLLTATASNQDGRSSALTAPSGPSQSAVMRAALAHTEHKALTTLQLHGTATPLGDPIEVGALVGGMRRPVDALPMTAVASKSWVGHSEAGSGVVGMVHALQGIVHLVAAGTLTTRYTCRVYNAAFGATNSS